MVDWLMADSGLPNWFVLFLLLIVYPLVDRLGDRWLAPFGERLAQRVARRLEN